MVAIRAACRHVKRSFIFLHSFQERLPIDYIERWLEVIQGDFFAVVFKSLCMCFAILFDLKRSDENPAFTSHQILYFLMWAQQKLALCSQFHTLLEY